MCYNKDTLLDGKNTYNLKRGLDMKKVPNDIKNLQKYYDKDYDITEYHYRPLLSNKTARNIYISASAISAIGAGATYALASSSSINGLHVLMVGAFITAGVCLEKAITYQAKINNESVKRR